MRAGDTHRRTILLGRFRSTHDGLYAEIEETRGAFLEALSAFGIGEDGVHFAMQPAGEEASLTAQVAISHRLLRDRHRCDELHEMLDAMSLN